MVNEMSNQKVKKEKTLLQLIRENIPNPDSYAVVAIKGSEVVYLFEGNGDVLIDHLPNLKEHMNKQMESNKLH